MNSRTLKLISIPLIIVVNFVSGFLPYYLIRRRIKKQQHNSDSPTNPFSYTMRRHLARANFFCGGVFLSTCFVGLYPSVTHKFTSIIKNNPDIPHYPYEALSLAFGFFFIWLLEITVHACLHCNTKDSEQPHSHNHTPPKSPTDTHSDSQRRSGHPHSSDNKPTNNKHCETHQPLLLQDGQNLAMQSINSATEESKPSDKMLEDSCSTAMRQSHNATATDEAATNADTEVTVVTQNDEDHGNEAHSHVPISGNLLGSIMLTFALGSHSIIEGLGFAMIQELGMVVNMLVTVVIHESVCAFSLGVNLASKRTGIQTTTVLLVTFSVLIPAGLALGILVNLGISENLFGEIITAVLQGVAAGTFVYVVFMEILPHELLNRDDLLVKVIMMMLGFAVIATMKIFHSHADSSVSSSNSTSMLSSTPASLINTKLTKLIF